MRRAAAALAAALVLTGCQGGGEPREPRVVTETRFLDELSAAIGAVNRTRAVVVRDAGAISQAAAALDRVDDVAVTGDRDAVRARRAPAAAALAKAAPAARNLGRDVRRYAAAVDGLANAPREGLDAVQSGAIASVVSAARAEVSRLRGYATVIASVWPRYEKLDETQRLWLQRASNGWYRDREEAAGAYAIMTDPRSALAKDRASLAGADRRRLAAARATDAEIARARGALTSLFG